jgi:signal transduction histidine kinase
MNNERVTLAQELHEGIAQDLVVLGFSIDQAISDCHDRDLKNSLRQIRFTTTALIEKVRAEMHQLRGAQPLQGEDAPLDTRYETLRIVQEVLRNVEKHSGASFVQIEIQDDGSGAVSTKEGSFGLLGIQERVEKLNGEISIESNSKGTKIGVTIPLER